MYEWHRVHRAAGHSSRELTDLMLRRGFFGDALRSLPARVRECDKWCDICQRAAFVRPPVPKKTANTRRAKLPGQRWHSDVCGPFPAAPGGERYMVTFVDDRTGLVHVSAVKRKKHAARAIQAMRAWLKVQRAGSERETSDVIECQTDRGGEYASGTADTRGASGGGKKRRGSYFDSYCAAEGISRRFTSAYTPSENGRAERMNRTLVEKMRKSLLEADVDFATGWVQAIHAAAFVHNRLPSVRGGPKSSPFRKFYGFGPDLKRLKPWGSMAAVQVRSSKGSLIRSEVLQFVGYPRDAKGWMFMRPAGRPSASRTGRTARIVVSRHARFDSRRRLDRDSYDPDRGVKPASRSALEDAARGVDPKAALRGFPIGLSDDQVRERAARFDQQVVRYARFDKQVHSGAPAPSSSAAGAGTSPSPAGRPPSGGAPRATVLLPQRLVTGPEAAEAVAAARQHGSGIRFSQDEPAGRRAAAEWRSYFDVVTFAEWDRREASGRVKHRMLEKQVMLGRVAFDAAALAALAARHATQERMAVREERRTERGLREMAAFVGGADEYRRKRTGPWDTGRGSREVADVVGEADERRGERTGPSRKERAGRRARTSSAPVEKRGGAASKPGGAPRSALIEKLYAMYGDEREPEAGNRRDEQLHAAHVAAVTGTTDPHYARAIEEFAMASINEVVCGVETPATIRQAQMLPEWPKWYAACQTELAALKALDVFEVVPKSEAYGSGKRIHRTKWVFKVKTTQTGDIERYKGRLVLAGYSLKQGIDYYDSYSSVVGYGTIRMLMQLAVQEDMTVSSADVSTAYLRAKVPPDTEVYVEMPKGFEEKDGTRYCYKLKRCLYGAAFSGRGWQQELEHLLVQKMGFRRFVTDKCVYQKEVDGEKITIVSYVDDLLCFTKSDRLRRWWKASLEKKFGKVAYQERADWVLNQRITRGVDAGSGRAWIQMDQERAVIKIAEAAGLLQGRGASSPMAAGEELRKNEGEPWQGESFEYASVLGGVLYVANLTRPDCAYAAHKLTRYIKNPGKSHYESLKRLVRYMYKTKHIGVRYWGGGDHPFRLCSACDSSFADCADTMRSTLGWGVWLGGAKPELGDSAGVVQPSGLVLWGSRIGKTVAGSTTEAEVQAALELLQDVRWARDFMRECGFEQAGSTRIYEDNNGCTAQIENKQGMKKARSYLVSLARLNEAHGIGTIHVTRVDSKVNSADLFTKALPGVDFRRHMQTVLGITQTGDQVTLSHAG